MADMTVYSYFNVSQLASLMDGISAITSSANYLDVFRIVALITFVVFIAGMATGKAKDPFEFFRWIIIMALIHSVLLVPKTNVIIVDRTGTAPPTVRANVPIGLAFFASVTSHIGDAMTRTFETVFALPDDLKFQKNGIMFGNTVLTDTLQAVPTTPVFRDDLTKFISNCTYYDILSARIDRTELSRSSDLWASMANTSYALVTPISTASEGMMSCRDAYRNLSARWDTEIVATLQSQGRVINPSALSNTAAAAMLSSQVSNSYAKLTGISKSATEILRQNMALNSMRDSQMVSAQKLESDSSAIVGAAQAQAELTTNMNYMVMARIAERAAPAIRNVVELICYAVFPVVILLLIVAGEHAGQVLKTYVMSLIWIQLIPPLYAVLNFVMTSTSGVSLVGIASSTSPDATVNLINIGQLSQHGLSDVAIAGYLTLSLPVIAWALVKGGEVGGAALFSSVLAPATGTSGHVAGNMAAGNISQGNVSMDTSTYNNVNANKYDPTPHMVSGQTKSTNAAGTSTYGTDGTYRHQSNLSSIGFSSNFGEKLGNSLSKEASQRGEVAKRESYSATESRAAAITGRMAIQKAYSDHHGSSGAQDRSSGGRAAESISELRQLAQNVNRQLGLSSDSSIGEEVVSTTTAGGSLDLASLLTRGRFNQLGIKLGKEAGISDTKGQQRKLGAAFAYAKDQLKSKNISSDTSLSDEFKESDAYQWGRQNRTESVNAADAALTRSKQHAHNAEVASSEAFTLSTQARTINENWVHNSMAYEGYIAKRINEDGNSAIFNMLYQTDPDRAAEMAKKYVAELTNDAMPTLPRLSNSISDVQAGDHDLDGKTLGTVKQEYGRPQDDTNAAFQQYQSEIGHKGYATRTIENTVGPEIEKDKGRAIDAIVTQGQEIAPPIDAAVDKSKGTLDRHELKGIQGPERGVNPAPGSTWDHIDKSHEDLYGPAPKPTQEVAPAPPLKPATPTDQVKK